MGYRAWDIVRRTADNNFSLFVNGVLVGTGDSWMQTYDFRPKVIGRPRCDRRARSQPRRPGWFHRRL
jgi:hypothetical protein